jgi:hypothetical protein
MFKLTLQCGKVKVNVTVEAAFVIAILLILL